MYKGVVKIATSNNAVATVNSTTFPTMPSLSCTCWADSWDHEAGDKLPAVVFPSEFANIKNF